MKHYFTCHEYDTHIDVLKSKYDYIFLSESKCKLCGFRPSVLRQEAREEVEQSIEKMKNDWENGVDIELIIRGEGYVMELYSKRYEEKMEKNEECDVKPNVIKTRDIDFVDFLLENEYTINNVVSLGRQKEKSSSSSDTQTYKGLFRFAQRARSSSYSSGERRDIAEYTLVLNKKKHVRRTKR
ncbi:MAG: hypothetical protein KJI69_05220 [Patescibacteria group bacterium]|nr:hypothetical protein [Patescibacteria group bacterium]